jgi:hypothetical protein
MIEESYVSFNTAKLLKEAGFDVPCTSQYTEGMGVWNVEYPYNFNQDEFGYSRPTQALADRWLREVYNVAIYSLYDDDMEQWFYVVDAFTKNPAINGFQSGSEYDDYESAFEDGLQEAIKLIKK